MRETERATDILRLLHKNHNCFVFNIAGSIYQTGGMPDCCIIPFQYREIWIEFKGPDTVLEPRQEAQIKKMRLQGANVFLVRFVGQKEWSIDDRFSIKFGKLAEGVSLLYHTLLGLCVKEEFKTCF